MMTAGSPSVTHVSSGKLMKDGDMVRFRAPHWLGGAGVSTDKRPWLVGLLVEYAKWEKMTSILYEGDLLRIPAWDVQKSGRKDCDENR